MSQDKTTPDYHRGLDDAANICAQAAIQLISNGRVRVNQVDRHTAEVLRSMERKILALKEQS